MHNIFIYNKQHVPTHYEYIIPEKITLLNILAKGHLLS